MVHMHMYMRHLPHIAGYSHAIIKLRIHEEEKIILRIKVTYIYIGILKKISLL